MRKKYLKPKIERVPLDYSIALQMQSAPPSDPPIRSGGNKGADEPFKTPFGDKPFK